MRLKKEKSVGVFLLPRSFVNPLETLWPWVGARREQAVPLGRERELRVAAGQARACSPAIPQPEEQSRSGDSRGGLTVRPAAGRQVPSEEVEAEDAKAVLRVRSRVRPASGRSSVAQADTQGNS